MMTADMRTAFELATAHSMILMGIAAALLILTYYTQKQVTRTERTCLQLAGVACIASILAGSFRICTMIEAVATVPGTADIYNWHIRIWAMAQLITYGGAAVMLILAMPVSVVRPRQGGKRRRTNSGWQRVSFSGDCLDGDEDERGNICSVCNGDYAVCPCPGDAQGDCFHYKEINGVLYAKQKEGAMC